MIISSVTNLILKFLKLKFILSSLQSPLQKEVQNTDCCVTFFGLSYPQQEKWMQKTFAGATLYSLNVPLPTWWQLSIFQASCIHSLIHSPSTD